jgi:hypothetical protein
VKTPHRWAAGLLGVGLLLAVFTPARVVLSEPSMSGYLLHPSIFLLQALPYVIAAVLWVPAWRWGSGTASAVLSAILLAVAVALYVPVIWRPSRWAGDMIGLAIVLVCGVKVASVVVVTAATALLSWRQRTA